jgi:hypothetical protein
MATPSAVPNSRVMSLRAEATPCFSRGRERVMASVEGPMETAKPMPMTMMPGRIDKTGPQPAANHPDNRRSFAVNPASGQLSAPSAPAHAPPPRSVAHWPF